MTQLKVLSFDFLNTLVKVKNPIPETYAKYAYMHGIKHPIDFPNRYSKSFKQLSEDIPYYGLGNSRQWWHKLAVQCYDCEDNDQFRNFTNHIYEQFNESSEWMIMPFMKQLLNYFYGYLPMIVISNSDERIYSILNGLEIDHFFENIIIPIEVGVGKPDRLIFEHALLKCNVENPTNVLHIGDDFLNDFIAPMQCGIRTILLQENSPLGIRPENLMKAIVQIQN